VSDPVRRIKGFFPRRGKAIGQWVRIGRGVMDANPRD
jgi:hypothetical protein